MSSGSPPDDDDGLRSPRNPEDDEFSFETGGQGTEHRLTLKGKIRRGGLAALPVVVAVFFLLSGPSTAWSWLTSLRSPFQAQQVPIATPPTLGNLTGSNLPMPGGVQNTLTVKFGPANGPDGFIYSCWTQQIPTSSGISRQFHVALWTRAIHSWILLPAPVATASICSVVPDRESENGVLLAIWPLRGVSSGSCLLPQLFHSDDAGELWNAVPWPSEIQPACNPQFFLAGGRLYVESSTALLPPDVLSPISAAGFLITTDTRTVSWRPADPGQANDTSFQLVGLRPGGRLLAESMQGAPGTYQSGLLWESIDSGLLWDIAAPLPGEAPAVTVSSNPAATDHGGWGYVYVTYFTGGIDSQAALGYGMLDTPGGGSWMTIPLPESTGSTLSGPMTGLLPDGGEGPLESLIYLRGQDATSHTLSPLYLPWLWNTIHKAWTLDPLYLPANAIPQGVSWENGSMTIIISVIHEGVEPSLANFSLTLTPRELAASP
jgi:hypothetical protein